jgi:hypothetical protein
MHAPKIVCKETTQAASITATFNTIDLINIANTTLQAVIVANSNTTAIFSFRKQEL